MQAPLEYDHEERTRFLVEAIQHQATNAQLAQASTPPTSHAFLLALLMWFVFTFIFAGGRGIGLQPFIVFLITGI